MRSTFWQGGADTGNRAQSASSASITLAYTQVMADSPCKTALTSVAISCPRVVMSLAESWSIGGSGGSGNSGSSGAASWSQWVPGLGRAERVLQDSDCCSAAISWANNRYKLLARDQNRVSSACAVFMRVCQGYSQPTEALKQLAARRCWCAESGQALLDALSPLPARSMMATVGRVCGQSMLSSLAICT